MRKRTFNRAPDKRQRYRDSLNNITDTQSTLANTRPDDVTDLNTYEDVPPPFKENDSGRKFITFRDFTLTFKTVCTVCGIVIIVVIPLVLFFSNLNYNVQSLRTDIDNLRNKIEILWGESIRQRAKIDAIEKYSSDGHSNSIPSPLKKK